MKRSLAKESLKAALDLYLSNETGEPNATVLSEIALTHLESVVGMQPPKRLWPLHEVLNPALPMISNTWEPEDETK